MTTNVVSMMYKYATKERIMNDISRDNDDVRMLPKNASLELTRMMGMSIDDNSNSSFHSIHGKMTTTTKKKKLSARFLSMRRRSITTYARDAFYRFSPIDQSMNKNKSLTWREIIRGDISRHRGEERERKKKAISIASPCTETKRNDRYEI